MIKSLFVTTFNQKLYNATGKQMLQSFISTKSEGRFFIAHENIDFGDSFLGVVSTGKLILQDTQKDSLYWEWHKKFKNYIPPAYGGDKLDWSEYNDYKQRDYNYQTGRWFWKIIGIKRALELQEIDEKTLITFVDSDCRFIQKVKYDHIKQILTEVDFVYHYGKFRKLHDKGFESGLYSIRGKSNASLIADWLYEKYISGDFLKMRRWDDGYVMSKILDELPNIKSKDLAWKIREQTSRVCDHSIFANYILHSKGIHHRSGVIPRNIEDQ